MDKGRASQDRVLRSDAAANRERILVAAREVFAARGLDATLAEVADHAGVGVGTVYRRFASKDELVTHLLTSRVEAVVAVASEAREIADPWEGLVYFLTESSLMTAQDRALRELMSVGSPVATAMKQPALDGLMRAAEGAHEVIHGHVSALVERAKEAGVLRADFEVTDVPLITQCIQASADIDVEGSELWRRILGLVIDGMRPAREGNTELCAPALTEARLRDAMNRIHGLAGKASAG